MSDVSSPPASPGEPSRLSRMRRLTPLSLYNRKASLSKAEPDILGKSLLAMYAVGEAPLLIMFVKLSGVKDPWEDA
jgi:hypothetical protein